MACAGRAPLWVESWTDALAQAPGLSNVVELAAGWDRSFAIDGEGNVYRWGEGMSVHTSNVMSGDVATPTLMPPLAGLRSIAAPHDFGLCALDSAGAPRCRLNGSCVPESLQMAYSTDYQTVPVSIGTGFEFLVSVENTYCAGKAEGVTCWGYLERGQPASEGNDCRVSEPLAIENTAGFRQLIAVKLEFCGLRDNGEVSCWGSPPHCLEGLPCPEATLVPFVVPELAGATRIFADGATLCGALPGGLLRCGQRSYSTVSSTTSPAEWSDVTFPDEVLGLGDTGAIYPTRAVLTADGRLWQYDGFEISPIEPPAGF